MVEVSIELNESENNPESFVDSFPSNDFKKWTFEDRKKGKSFFLINYISTSVNKFKNFFDFSEDFLVLKSFIEKKLSQISVFNKQNSNNYLCEFKGCIATSKKSARKTFPFINLMKNSLVTL